MAIQGIRGSSQGRLLNNIAKTSNKLNDNVKKIASGLRVTKAADDAAALSIATNLNSDITATKQAIKNVDNGITILANAEGGLMQINSLLSRAKELAIQSSNGTLTDSARKAINTEFTNITSEISRIAQSTEFNGRQLLGGDLAASSSTQVNIQVGIGNAESDTISINVIEDVTSEGLDLAATNLSTQHDAQNALSAIDDARDIVTSVRSHIGSLVNRFGRAAENLGVSAENLTSAFSSLQDLDVASETSDLNKNLVIQKIAIKTLNQANKLEGGLTGSLLDIEI